MKLVAFSDTHNQHESLTFPPGDVLIFAGDATNIGSITDTTRFIQFIGQLDYEHKIVIMGNHDFSLEKPHTKEIFKQMMKDEGIHYLEDKAITIEGKRFFGSPYTPEFFDWAFMKTPAQLENHWEIIPKDVDVLITHGPPHGILDRTARGDHVGCPSLLKKVKKVKPAVHIFGHIHEGAGHINRGNTDFYNVSMLDERYRVKHNPVVIEI